MAFRDLDKADAAKEIAVPIDPTVAALIRSRISSYALTNKEKQIVMLVLSGLSNKEIARSIAIAEQTVKDHLKHVYGKMGVHQRTALYAKVVGLGAPRSPHS